MRFWSDSKSRTSWWIHWSPHPNKSSRSPRSWTGGWPWHFWSSPAAWGMGRGWAPLKATYIKNHPWQLYIDTIESDLAKPLFLQIRKLVCSVKPIHQLLQTSKPLRHANPRAGTLARRNLNIVLHNQNYKLLWEKKLAREVWGDTCKVMHWSQASSS